MNDLLLRVSITMGKHISGTGHLLLSVQLLVRWLETSQQ